jgi:hypothetical protein
VCCLWAATVITIPIIESRRAAASRPTGMTWPVYVAGGWICHQRPERSFHWNGTQFPVCARCTGLYAGAPLGALVAVGRRRRRPGPASPRGRVIAAAAIPTVATVVLEYGGLVDPGLAGRALAAIPLGGMVAHVLTDELMTP